jgi:hypothetical protein
VLAADAELDVRTPDAAEAHRGAHELADAGLIDRREGRGLEDLVLDVAGDDPALDIVAGEPNRGLREVVGAE